MFFFTKTDAIWSSMVEEALGQAEDGGGKNIGL